jgi:hypothetical protein
MFGFLYVQVLTTHHLTRDAMTTLPAAKQPLALQAASSGGSCPLTPRAMARECRIQ